MTIQKTNSQKNQITKLSKLEIDHADYLYRLKRNTFVIEELNLFYIDTPKAGSTAVKSVLASFKNFNPKDHLGSPSKSTRELLVHDRNINPIPSLRDFSLDKQEEILFDDSWSRFCLVRNPYTRIFSAWFNKILLQEPEVMHKLQGYPLREKYLSVTEIYEDFQYFVDYIDANQSAAVLDPHWDTQSRLLFKDTLDWDAVIKLEDTKSLTNYLARKGFKDFKINHMNTSNFDPDMSKVDYRTLKIIKTHYYDDFIRYGYDPNDIPNEKQAHGQETLTRINAIISKNIRYRELLEDYQRTTNMLNHAKRDLISLTERFFFRKIYSKTAKRIRKKYF